MIETRYDQKRGCGYRKPGGLYLMSGGEGRACGKLPFALTVCPTCHAGIHFARGWTWIDADRLLATQPCTLNTPQIEYTEHMQRFCSECPLNNMLLGKAGLLWIGEKFYPTPAHYIEECNRLGISRRVSAVPREFELGKTWVLLAHKKCIAEAGDCTCGVPDGPGLHLEKCGHYTTKNVPGIFRIFKPDAIEYVTKGTESEEELAALVKRGITPVKVDIAQLVNT